MATLQPTLDAITGMLERGNGQEEALRPRRLSRRGPAMPETHPARQRSLLTTQLARIAQLTGVEPGQVDPQQYDNPYTPRRREWVQGYWLVPELWPVDWGTREGVDESASQAERLREGVAALCELRQREDTSIGIEMFVDAAVDLLEAFRALEAGILDVQAEVDTLEAEIAEENGQEA